MNGCWNLSTTFSVPMEICLSPLVNVMNYIDLIVYPFYPDKLYPFLYIVSIEWALYTLNLSSSSIYSKLIQTHLPIQTELWGSAWGRWEAAPAWLVVNGQSIHRYEHQWYLVFICFWSWSLWNTVHRLQKLESHLGYLFEEPSLSFSPNLWHQRLSFIAKSSGTVALGWLPLGRVRKGWWLRAPLRSISLTSVLHMPQLRDLAAMGRGSRGPADREVGPCWDLGDKPLKIGQGRGGLFAGSLTFKHLCIG